MISLKLAWRNVTRRKTQNLSVLIGIALGVSLFVGIQIGSESLGTSFGEIAEHSLGKTEARISPLFTSFVTTNETVANALNPNQANVASSNLIETVLKRENVSSLIEGISQRVSLPVTLRKEEIGSIEVDQTLLGISKSETGFGKFFDNNSQELSLKSLQPGEAYIGRQLATKVFGTNDFIGSNLTVSSLMFSLPVPALNISAQPVPWGHSIKIVGIFEDTGRGEELFSNFLVLEIEWLQEQIVTTFIQAQLGISATQQTTNPILGFGEKPVNQILINWKEEINSFESRELAFNTTRDEFKKALGTYQTFHVYSNTLNVIKTQTEATITSINTLLSTFGYLIILAAIFVIVNIQLMALQAREKETGIITAMGASRWQIVISNLLESLFVGVVGSVVGLVGGLLYGQALILFLGFSFGFDTSLITLVLTPSAFISSFIAGIIISQSTGLYPAIKASFINTAQVIRGVYTSPSEKFGKYSLALGVLITLLGLYLTFILEKNPFFEGRNAFTTFTQAERIFLPIALIAIGIPILIGYFWSRKAGLTTLSLGLSGWAYFNIFVIFEWVDLSSAFGFSYLLYIMLSLIFGAIIFVYINLDFIAILGEQMIAFLTGPLKNPIKGTSMVAFRQMKSNKLRSTLTFALFAIILTLNIFIATWSHSSRFGLDNVVQELSGNTDVIIISSPAIEKSVNFDQNLLDEFGSTSRDIHLEYVKSFSKTSTTAYYKQEQQFRSTSLSIVAGDSNAMWSDDSHDNWLMRFNLQDEKSPDFEYYTDQPTDSEATKEDEKAWEAVFTNKTTSNGLPVIITTRLQNFQIPTPLVETGGSIYLNLTDNTLQEFQLIAVTPTNPISSFIIIASQSGTGPPSSAVAFINNFWASRLQSFAGIVETEEIFIGNTNVEKINDASLSQFLLDVEFWANSADGKFRQTHDKSYGIYGVTVYSLFEQFLEGQYNFFQFLQAFVSVGLIVGILGLFVVAYRSVAERQRQIGMLRALGLRRVDVVISIVIELVVTGLIGLMIGLINGNILAYSLVRASDGMYLIPWTLIFLYAGLTLGCALIAAIIPGYAASKIPPSDALRYTG